MKVEERKERRRKKKRKEVDELVFKRGVVVGGRSKISIYGDVELYGA